MVTGRLTALLRGNAVEWGMTKWVRFAFMVAGVLCTGPAAADELRANEARAFVAGRHFAYTCFDGTTGAGRIHADGSAVGYIRISGRGEPRFVALPAGTLRVQNDQWCAQLRGLPFSPCFNVDRTSSHSFRGSVSGLGFAYCDFHRRSTRADLVRPSPLRLSPPALATAN
jgi:hypothetical protein